MEMTETVTHDPSSRLEVLRTEHRDLDVAVLEDLRVPDIIA